MCRSASDSPSHHPTTTANTPPSTHMPGIMGSLGTSCTTFLTTTSISHTTTHTPNQISLSNNSSTSAKKPFSPNVSSPRPDEASSLFPVLLVLLSPVFAFHLLRLVLPDAPLSLQSVQRAPCDPTPSQRLSVVSAPLSSRLHASCLLLPTARILRPSQIPSGL